jgi:hypothetical protein
LNGTGQVVVNAGALATPTIAATGDLNTGIYFPAADTVAFVEGGAEVLRLNSSAQVVIAGSGTAALPILTIAGDTNTGIYSPGADQFGITTAGTAAMTIDASGNTFIAGALGVGIAADSSITVNVDKTYTTNGTRYGIDLNTSITDSTLSASRTNYGILNVNTITQASLGAFTLTGYGQYNQILNGSANDVTSNATTMFGTRSLAQNRATGTVGSLYGAYNQATNARSGSTTTTMIAGYNISSITLGTVTNAYGSYNEVQIDGGTLTTAFGTYNFFDRNAGTMTTAYGSYTNFDGTIGTKLGNIVEGGATMDFGITGAPTGSTNATIKFGVVDTTTPTNSQNIGRLSVDNVAAYVGTNFTIGSATTSIPSASIIFSTSGFPNTTGNLFGGECGALSCSDDGAGAATVDLIVGDNLNQVLRAIYDPLATYPYSTQLSGNDISVYATDNMDIRCESGPVGISSSVGPIALGGPSVVYTMTTGDLFKLEGNNTGLTGDTPINILRFVDTDTSTALNQPLGKIEFFTSDASSPGVRVVSYILSSALGTSGGGTIRIGTSANAGTVAETFRFDTTGCLSTQVYASIVGATNRDLFVDNTGRFGYVSSVRASKTNITDITDTSWLLALNPVSFNYRKKDEEGNYLEEIDGTVPDFGLIAEDVEQVKPELCFYDETEAGPALRGVTYRKLITPMLKLLQEQQAMINEMKAEIAALKAAQP